MIQFVKILEYELNPGNEDVFEYLCKLTRQTIDPPSKAVGKLELSADVVLHSPLRRAAECLRKNPQIEYRSVKQLREILFNLEKNCSREEWKREGEVIARKNFKNAFIEDRLPVSRKQIFKEIKTIISLCKRVSGQNRVAVVSHSFRLKLIEAFLRTGGGIEKNPELIEDYIFDNEKTYDFGEGFSHDLQG